MKKTDLIIRPWRDYELIDSGDNRKFERFGKVLLIRPETQALWRPMRPEFWKRANGEFRFDGGKGSWIDKKNLPESWELGWGDAKFSVRLTSFKHIGVFPEQAANWEWIAERTMEVARARKTQPHVLNLFGYTGIATIVAARAGAALTHVDASRQSNEWAKENAILSEVPAEASSDAGSIRYIFDDALKFVEREVRRGAAYDGIILDPPAFGRGAKGEVWHIEEQLPRLLEALAKILNTKPGSFFLLNGYAAGYSPQAFLQAASSAFPEMKKSLNAEFGELQIAESGEEVGSAARVVPSGIYVRFVLS
jgi:23S rRNA (cytosine1962-C5)-methyltransferase